MKGLPMPVSSDSGHQAGSSSISPSFLPLNLERNETGQKKDPEFEEFDFRTRIPENTGTSLSPPNHSLPSHHAVISRGLQAGTRREPFVVLL